MSAHFTGWVLCAVVSLSALSAPSQVSHPLSGDSSNAFTSAENMPLHLDSHPVDHPSMFRFTNLLALALAIALAGGCTYLFIKLTRGAKIRGSKKYLIEHLSTYQVSPKASVTLLKVGEEFVLVGVTPQQVTPLSSLPLLTKTYQEEHQFERDVFREAVSSEVKSLQNKVQRQVS